MDFSVLMSVYQYEKPDYLRQSLDSIFNQTMLPTEVILVEDGKLTTELYHEIRSQKEKHPEIQSVVLKENVGLGNAMRIGLTHCHYDIIARMDTDDVCMPNRFELQISFLCQHPEISVVGSWIKEFVGTTDNVVGIRNLPEYPDEINVFAKSRNPMNHPTVIFRKKSVEEAGSYQSFPLFEDYYLWARMLIKGYQFYNIQEPLLLFRRSQQMMKRRGGVSYAMNEIRLQKSFRKIGFISTQCMLKNILTRTCVRIIPNILRSWIYLIFLRKSIDASK